jgi:SAM-dependent methyltransferase
LPEDLEKYYQSETYVSHSETKKGVINTLYHIAQKFNLNTKFQLCQGLAIEGLWADYGSGAGAFAHYSQQHGKSIKGFEPDAGARAASTLKGVHSLPVKKFPDGTSYACITLWHVVEHIPNFLTQLQLLSDALLPGGILVLAMPNHLSHDALRYKSHWAAYDLPRHLWHFTRKDVLRIAQTLDLKLESTQPMYLDSFYVSMLSESYKSGSKLRGIWNGLLSNINSAIGRHPYSSQIYILRK